MEVMVFMRKHPLPIVSAVLAVLSMALVPPSEAYLGYIDVRVLCILFCFMAAIEGMRRKGVFDALATRMLHGNRGIGMLCLALVMLPFLCSMVITNDVSLITFVPFAILVLGMAGRRDLIIPVVVLQTLAANLGCMATPFGSPHNILLFSTYPIDLPGFLVTVIPMVVVGGVVIALLALRPGREPVRVELDERRVDGGWRLWLMCLVFILSVSAVLGWVPYWIVLAVAIASVLVADVGILRGVDYDLLLTFVFLFVFTGNLANTEGVSAALEGLMAWDPMLASIGVSQVMSNVPATVMLSNFTDDWQGMLAGINIGGFGTPIASMASVISFRLYGASEDPDTGRFLMVFTAMNVLMLAVLIPIGMLST